MRQHIPTQRVRRVLRAAAGVLRLGTLALLLSAGARVVAVSGEAGNATPLSPLPAAHAHNDYEHTRPLLDALDLGFCSVEADIHRVGNVLLVGHDAADLRGDRTLEQLYLKPLQERSRRFGGRIHAQPASFTLLIDIKTDAEATYQILRPMLRRYRAMLTRFTPGKTTPGAVTVILSGERPIQTVASERIRWCAIDGRFPDLASNPSVHLIPLVSSSWLPTFSWRGDGEIPEQEFKRLLDVVGRAHDQGRRVRFWGTADDPNGWRVLRAAGVDLINADDLPALRRFLESEPGGRPGQGGSNSYRPPAAPR